MSKLSVTWFLPCLLFSQIGPLATWENLKSYWIVIVLSLVFQLVSLLFGIFGVQVLKLPQWITPCLVFNNATSLPLLLLESLAKVGTLSQIVLPGDTLDGVLQRGRVYVLINALICNLTRFTFGPYLMKNQHPHIFSHFETPHLPSLPEKLLHPFSNLPTSAPSVSGYPVVVPYAAEETAPLIGRTSEKKERLKGWMRKAGRAVEGVMNPPMWGGLAACVAGLIPFLRHWLFDEEGILSPLSQSLSNLGSLYTILQMFILGAHLYSKKTSHRPPHGALAYLFVYRFAIMPIVSVGTVVLVRRWAGGWVKRDPVLDFVMAICPVGPPALTLAAIVEMADTGAETEAAVAQTIMLSYIVTPLISFSVSGALEVVHNLYN